MHGPPRVHTHKIACRQDFATLVLICPALLRFPIAILYCSGIKECYAMLKKFRTSGQSKLTAFGLHCAAAQSPGSCIMQHLRCNPPSAHADVSAAQRYRTTPPLPDLFIFLFLFFNLSIIQSLSFLS